MKKSLIYSFLFFYFLGTAVAQTTAVTFTVTDSTTQIWFGGKWSVKFVPNPNYPNITSYNINGTPLNPTVLNQSGTTDSSGAGSVTVYQNSAISPGGSQWQITMCPQASSLCGNYTFSTASNSSMDISTALTNIIPVPNFPAVAGSYGYNSNEARITLAIGATYWDVTNNCQEYDYLGWFCYNTNGSGGGGGGGGVTSIIPGFGIQCSPSSPNCVGNVTVAVQSGPTSPIVQYNPPTTAYVFLSFSGLYDDNRILSSAVPVSNFTCTGGTCTVNTSSAHNLGAGSFVDMTASATPFTSANQQPMTGSFKVLTIPTSTQFTFAYSSSASCSSSCGNIYDASYWAIYQAATQPFLNNHGTVYGIEQALSTVAGAPSTYINCSLGTGGAPTYLIIEAGQDDINGGASAASIETYLQTIWTYAHNNGCNVIQGSITPANYGGFPSFDFSIYQVLNEWLPLQNKNFTSSSNGQYWDKFIDYNSYFYWRGPSSSFTLGGATSASYAFGQRTNEAFSSQSSNYPNEPPLFNQGDPRNGIQIDNTFTWYFNYSTLQGTGTPTNYWMTLNCCNVGDGLDIYSWFGHPLLNLYGPLNGDMCYIDGGRDTSTTYNSGLVCFNYISNANNANYMHFNLFNTGDILRLYGTGVAAFPSLPSLPSSGTVGLLIDHNGNISTGSASATTFDETWTTDISSAPFVVNSTTAWTKATFTVALANTMPDTNWTGVCSADPPTGTVSAGAPFMMIYAIVPISTSAGTITIQNGDTTTAVVTTTAAVHCHIFEN